MAQSKASQGFYVFQQALGSPLQFQPTLGTAELDELMNAHVPGPASMQDKRATISLDFFDHVSLTGESIKFYPVSNVTPVSANSSPTSLQDSGYGSGFSASPMAPTWNWDMFAQDTVPSFSSVRSTSEARRTEAAPSRQRTSDFSHLPGMKILTKDGRDVTNAASRGCKTKEQRDHAHLMRIMKACDSCRRKKIRCDPSHKSRDGTKSPRTSQTSSSRHQHAQKQAPHSKRKPVAETSSPPRFMDTLGQADLFALEPLPELAMYNGVSLDLGVDGWQDSTFLNQEILDGQQLGTWSDQDDYDWFNDPLGLLSPVSPAAASAASASSATSASSSPSWSSTTLSQGQYTPGSQQSASPLVPSALDSASRAASEDGVRQPRLPYLDNSGPAHEYLDFNLYSPTASLADDELSVFAEDMSRHVSSNVLSEARALSGTLPDGKPCSSSATLHRSPLTPTCSVTNATQSMSSPGDAPASQPRRSPMSVVLSRSISPAVSRCILGSESPFSTGETRQQVTAEPACEVHEASPTSTQPWNSPQGVYATPLATAPEGEVVPASMAHTTVRRIHQLRASSEDTARDRILESCLDRSSIASAPGGVSCVAVNSLDPVQPAGFQTGSTRHSPVNAGNNVVVHLQLVAISMLAISSPKGEIAKQSGLGRVWHSVLVLLACTLAVGALLHAMTTVSSMSWFEASGFKDSLPSLAFCACAYVMSRSMESGDGVGIASSGTAAVGPV